MKKEKTYLDPRGDAIPARHVPPYDKKRDATAKAILRDFLKAERMLADLKERAIARIRELQEFAAKQAGVKPLGGLKGCIQFRDFAGMILVKYDADARTEFDERLAMAQQLINEAVQEMTADSRNSDLVEIVSRAFQPRRSGRLDMQRIRDLRNYKVSHPKWKQAVEIIRNCERQVGTRAYIRVAVREARDQKPRTIHLDIAKV